MARTKRQIQSIFFAMGTVCTITVYREEHRAAVREAKQRVLELHQKLNAYDPASEISRINRDAGVRPAAVSRDTLSLIGRCIDFSRQTDGLFDITTTPVSRLWKDCIRAKILPLEYERARAAALVDCRDVLLYDHAVALRRKGQQIDLGAIAKGYAADEVRRILFAYGVDHALINLGGTVTVMGREQNVGIQKPFAPTGSAFASIRIQDRAVVTSGLYEQGFSQGGRTYHHIIHPKTGFPSTSELTGVTLVGESAETLDALSTAAFMLSVPQAAKLLQSCGIEAIFVTKDGGVYITEHLQNDFHCFSKGA